MNVLILAYTQGARKIQYAAILMEIILVAVLIIMKVGIFIIVIGRSNVIYPTHIIYFSIIGDPYEGCIDIDECQSSSKNNCTQGLDCVNLDPSFRCKCQTDQLCKHINS